MSLLEEERAETGLMGSTRCGDEVRKGSGYVYRRDRKDQASWLGDARCFGRLSLPQPNVDYRKPHRSGEYKSRCGGVKDLYYWPKTLLRRARDGIEA
jgi:hypothetical protein